MAGYYGNSMSNNAMKAYQEGKKPVSRITKDDLLKHGVNESIIFFKWYVNNKCHHCEWHHSSPKYNITYFYDIEECCNQLKKADIDKLKTEYIEQVKSKPNKRVDEKPYYAKVQYSISTFKGKRIHFETYAIVYNNWAYVMDDYKKDIIKKNINAKHFCLVEEYETRPKEMPENIANTILERLKLKT
jgi:hypothetical protein